MKIPLIFKNYKPDTRSHFWGDQIFIYDLIKDFVEEVDSLDDKDGAVIFVRSNGNIPYIREFNDYIAKLKWCLIILTENENCNNFYKMIKHSNCKIWLQTPGSADEADYFLPFGYPVIIEGCDNKDRKYDWFFSGQVTHETRVKCVKVLRGIENGKLVETGGFNQGLPHLEYIEYMRDSKVVPCPGGVATQDTFRIYEALESGCVPVVSKGYIWSKIFEEVPFPVIDSWEELPAAMKQITDNWEAKQLEVIKWWADYKLKVREDFLMQLSSLESNL